MLLFPSSVAVSFSSFFTYLLALFVFLFLPISFVRIRVLEQRLARIEMEEAIRIREMNNILMMGLAQGPGGLAPGPGQIEQHSPVGHPQQQHPGVPPRNSNNHDGSHGDNNGGSGVGIGSIASPGPYYGDQHTRSIPYLLNSSI